ncbi:MAG: arylesterase, partial [bacterium (Candidatus Ratteibacteria) CG_4_10_14_3_um_filter_41_18]
LCYGDSNTWGYIPATAKRYAVGCRWPGVLQKLLGDSWEVIEEGVNSRTTVFDDPKHIGKNGKTYLVPCLETHNPIDIVILYLGTNDLKERFNRSVEQ